MSEQPSAYNNNNTYTVVARRYRPQAFLDLVGQPHVIKALSNAIDQSRVGHAYLFTGARGVGKTSTARIFAKCLNCVTGPTTAPCNECEVCRSVSTGEDVDVLEIDGASNRGIDEIRQLRSNANVRPSRCRFKIYIIDEVHMLTVPAFNALLKTLEEPPDHVKFIFCTTDPHKIPITVLSRCQRFDFAPVEADEITTRLQEIAEKEGVVADKQALEIIARRANGSMRDSQSLLEQILSFCDKSIDVQDVYRLLGTADMGRVAKIVSCMVSKNMPETMAEIDGAIKSGVDVGQLAQQMVGYIRDLMVSKVGCNASLMLNVTGTEFRELQELSQDLGLDTIFSMLQILDQSVTRMQNSHHSRVLLEAAALRCCELENLQPISELLATLGSGSPTPSVQSTERKPPTPTDSAKKKIADAAASAPLSPHPIAALSPSATVLDKELNSQAEDRAEHPDEPNDVLPEATLVRQESSQVLTNQTTDSSQRDASVSAPQAAVQGNSETISSSATPAESVTADHVTLPVQAAVDVVAAGPPSRSISATPVSNENLEKLWRETLEELGGMTADFGADFQKIEMSGSHQVKITLKQSYNVQMCMRPERRQKFEETLGRLLDRNIAIQFDAVAGRVDQAETGQPRMTRFQRMRSIEKNTFVKAAIDLFAGEVLDVTEARVRR